MSNHMTKPCIRRGYCCKQAPCPYGEGVPCIQLGGDKPGEHFCKIHDYIVQQPGAEFSPAFGAGCCSTLNSDRRSLQTTTTTTTNRQAMNLQEEMTNGPAMHSIVRTITPELNPVAAAIKAMVQALEFIVREEVTNHLKRTHEFSEDAINARFDAMKKDVEEIKDTVDSHAFDVCNLAEQFDVCDLAEQFDVSEIADRLLRNGIAPEIANHIDASEIANYIDASDIAGYVEVDHCEIAEEVIQNVSWGEYVDYESAAASLFNMMASPCEDGRRVLDREREKIAKHIRKLEAEEKVEVPSFFSASLTWWKQTWSACTDAGREFASMFRSNSSNSNSSNSSNNPNPK